MQELFDHILQHRSNWSKPGGHCRKLEEDGFIIRWYSDNSTITVSEAQGGKIKRYLLHMSTKELDSNVDLSVSFADKQVDLDWGIHSVNDDESRFESLLNNDNELDRTNVDNLCIILEEIRSIEERLDQKINNIALDVCRIKEADNLKSLVSRDPVNHITEENTILKAENATLREKVDYTTRVISDLNTKLKRLEEENQSYIMALNILQVDELQCDIQKPGQSATINMKNDKLQPKQLEISSISEYNIPVGNGFSPLIDEGEQHDQAQGITNDLDLNNTFQQQQQQQQQYSACNQLTERVYTKVRTVKPSVQTREHIDHPNSVFTEPPLAPKDNKDECDKDECDAKTVETYYYDVLHTTSNESINEVIETSTITQQKQNNAEVVALSSALVNNAKTSEQSEVGQNQSSKIVEKTCPDSWDGFIGVDRKRRRYKKFFLSGISENVKESQIYSYLSQRGIIPSVISIFKSKRRGTISAKIHFPSASRSTVVKKDFWPKFVCCKAWIQKTKNKNKPLEGNFSTYV